MKTRGSWGRKFFEESLGGRTVYVLPPGVGWGAKKQGPGGCRARENEFKSINTMSDIPSHLTQKPRSTSTLYALSKEQAEQLATWPLEENRSYDEVVELVASTFGVTTSRSALSRYYDGKLLPLRLEEDMEDLAEWHEYDEPDYETAWLVRAKQLGFHALAARAPDVATAERMFRIVLATERALQNRERTELEQRRMMLLERRAMRWGATATPTPGTESPRAYRMFLELVKDGVFNTPNPSGPKASEGKEK